MHRSCNVYKLLRRIVRVLELAGGVMEEFSNPSGPRKELVNSHCSEFMQLMKKSKIGTNILRFTIADITGPEGPPSPDYVPGPEEPEQAPPLPIYIPFVLEPVYPESSLPGSPGYIPESDPEEDLEEDDEEDPEEDPADYPADRGDDDDDAEDEHLAPADPTAVAYSADQDPYIPYPTPPPSPFLSISSHLLMMPLAITYTNHHPLALLMLRDLWDPELLGLDREMHYHLRFMRDEIPEMWFTLRSNPGDCTIHPRRGATMPDVTTLLEGIGHSTETQPVLMAGGGPDDHRALGHSRWILAIRRTPRAYYSGLRAAESRPSETETLSRDIKDSEEPQDANDRASETAGPVGSAEPEYQRSAGCSLKKLDKIDDMSCGDARPIYSKCLWIASQDHAGGTEDGTELMDRRITRLLRDRQENKRKFEDHSSNKPNLQQPNKRHTQAGRLCCREQELGHLAKRTIEQAAMNNKTAITITHYRDNNNPRGPWWPNTNAMFALSAGPPGLQEQLPPVEEQEPGKWQRYSQGLCSGSCRAKKTKTTR
ncbi:hypothetical protein Tco_1253438 [Tanacetum coccineum]